MADRFWSISAGQDKVAVAETGVTTGAAHVEVRITYDNAALVGNKALALTMLRHLISRITEDSWPPA
jgi:hypothetical protein